MVNYWFEIITEERNEDLSFKAVIRANSDILFITGSYLSIKDADLAATLYIKGFKDARGEYDE